MVRKIIGAIILWFGFGLLMGLPRDAEESRLMAQREGERAEFILAGFSATFFVTGATMLTCNRRERKQKNEQ